MLMPKKVKYRKQQRGRMCGKAWRGSDLSFGDYGLKVMECGYITDRQIEASRIAMTRFIKRGGKVWLRLFPDKPITKKPAETRMGKGKGAPDHWVCVVRPGRILFEMEGVTPELAKEAMRLAAHKLPLKTSFVQRHDVKATVARPSSFSSLKEKTMEFEKIRNLSDEELKSEQAKAGEQLFRIRFQKSLGNNEGIKKLRTLKLDIARIKTVARQRTLAAEKAANPVVANAAPAKSTRTARKKAKKD